MTTTDRINSISDIARLAGVSKSTVSRALNDSPLISAETKERIRSLARAHGFEIDVRAQRLSLQRSGAIALVAYGFKDDPVVPDAFMLGIMTGIAAGLRSHGYDLLLVHVARKDATWPRHYLEAGKVDGFITLQSQCSREQFEALVAAKAPFVVWGAPSPANAYCSVGGDSLTGGRIATEHLLGRGRRRIAFLGGPQNEPEVQDRLRGYKAALEAAGVAVDPDLIVYGTFSEGSGTAKMAELLDRVPDLDGVFVCSDAMAIAAMAVARERGRAIPDEISVVGYDDIAAAHIANPPLTTIRQDPTLAGRLLADSVLQYLRTSAVTNVSIPAELVVRESS